MIGNRSWQIVCFRDFATRFCLVIGILSFLLYATWFEFRSPPHFDKLSIALLPIGPVSSELLFQLKKDLEHEFQFEIVILTEQPLPHAAYYERNERYRAAKLISYLSAFRATGVTHIVGVTEAEISATTWHTYDFGIAGLAERYTPEVVVSLALLRPGAESAAHLRERLAKLVVHELGHALGLRHCQSSKRCVMQDAEEQILTLERIDKAFCAECRRLLLDVFS